MLKKYFLIIVLGIIFISGCGLKKNNEVGINEKQIKNNNEKDWEEILGWKKSCPEGREVNGYRVDKDEYVVLIECFKAAYQSNFKAYYYNETSNEIKQLDFDHFYYDKEGVLQREKQRNFTSMDAYDDIDIVNDGFKLVVKGAGHFGCGEVLIYKWSDNDDAFDLIVASGHFNCNDPVPFEEWPVVYP